MEDLLQQFPVIIENPVVWGEMDSFSHVNNVVYFRYFETARMAYFERINYGQILESTGIGPILHSANCRFRIPLTYPDTISIGIRGVDIERDRFTMEYRILSHQHKKIAAEGSGIIVTYDYTAGRKADMPAEMRERIERIEAGGRPHTDQQF